MRRVRCSMAFAIFLVAALSCSERSKVTNHEEYPDFSRPIQAKPMDDGITLCTSKLQRAHYHVVTIRQMQFQPAELMISKGDTVVWVNCDITAHDVTEETRKAWLSSTLTNPQSWMKVVSENADYYCSIHLVMKGRLRIRQTVNGSQ